MKKILCLIFLIFLYLNIVDILASKKMVSNQLAIQNVLVSGPLNAILYLGSPANLKTLIEKSPILKPTIEIFPHVELIRSSFPIIKKEALDILSSAKPIKNDLFFRGIADEGWKRFYLKWYGSPDPLALQKCPETVKLIQSIPEVHLAMFSILMPGSKITPHYGPTRMCLRYHLGISTPNSKDCHINVSGNKYFWKDQEDVMFDDTFRHEVVNNTDTPRIILFLDVERPQINLTKPIEKAMIKFFGPLTTRTNEKQEKQEKQKQIN
jgi:beta-hydroxylase